MSRVVVSSLLVALASCATSPEPPVAPPASQFSENKPRPHGVWFAPGPRSLAAGFALDPLAGTEADPSTRPGTSSRCSLAFGLSGGGTVSASFAYGVLEQLESTRPVLREVDYLSTASGGGITASLVIDMLRESRLRGDEAALAPYFASARFRSALDADWLGQGAFVAGAIGGTTPKQLLEGLDRASPGGLRWSLSPATLLEAATAFGAPIVGQPGFPECSRTPIPLADAVDSPACRVPGVRELTFDDVWKRGSPLPVWLPGVTVFDTGTNVPFVPHFIDALGLVAIRFAAGADWVPRAQFTYRHALALSMAFPGIGPVLARATGAPPRYVDLADGGQSDNLGVLHATAAVSADLRAKRSERGLVIVVDGAITLGAPWHQEEWSHGKRLKQTLFNADPPLAAFRALAPRLADSIAREAGVASSVRVVFVKLSDLLEGTDPVDFPALHRPDCLLHGRPMDREGCLDRSRPTREHPYDRFRPLSASLSLTRREVEDLVLAGNLVAARHPTLASALAWCLAD